MPNKTIYKCTCIPDQYDPLCPACFTRTTTVQILPEQQLVLDRFQLSIREVFGIGIDVMERHEIAMLKAEEQPNLLKQRNYYESVSK